MIFPCHSVLHTHSVRMSVSASEVMYVLMCGCSDVQFNCAGGCKDVWVCGL